MKIILFLSLFALVAIQCRDSGNQQNINFNKEEIMDTQNIIEAVHRFFIAVDDRDWKVVETSFSDTVLLDYTSLVGGEPASLKPDQIIDSWKKVLPGFDKTHHQLGNYLTEVNSKQAKVFCYGTATHYLVNETGNNVWTVVGSYDFELNELKNTWQITKMKFNFKYSDGNNDLPKLAQERLKK
jgi:hypothetical protein